MLQSAIYVAVGTAYSDVHRPGHLIEALPLEPDEDEDSAAPCREVTQAFRDDAEILLRSAQLLRRGRNQSYARERLLVEPGTTPALRQTIASDVPRHAVDQRLDGIEPRHDAWIVLMREEPFIRLLHDVAGFLLATQAAGEELDEPRVLVAKEAIDPGT
jgi:hypothetical protein